MKRGERVGKHWRFANEKLIRNESKTAMDERGPTNRVRRKEKGRREGEKKKKKEKSQSLSSEL